MLHVHEKHFKYFKRGLKTSQGIIYVKEYFYVFLHPEKYYISTK